MRTRVRSFTCEETGMTTAEIKKTAEQKMSKSVESFKGELQKIRTGRAHPGILDQVQVDYYGSMVPISQVDGLDVLAPEPIALIRPGSLVGEERPSFTAWLMIALKNCCWWRWRP